MYAAVFWIALALVAVSSLLPLLLLGKVKVKNNVVFHGKSQGQALVKPQLQRDAEIPQQLDVNINALAALAKALDDRKREIAELTRELAASREAAEIRPHARWDEMPSSLSVRQHARQVAKTRDVVFGDRPSVHLIKGSRDNRRHSVDWTSNPYSLRAVQRRELVDLDKKLVALGEG